jgi:hypothetical protein
MHSGINPESQSRVAYFSTRAAEFDLRTYGVNPGIAGSAGSAGVVGTGAGADDGAGGGKRPAGVSGVEGVTVSSMVIGISTFSFTLGGTK